MTVTRSKLHKILPILFILILHHQQEKCFHRKQVSKNRYGKGLTQGYSADEGSG